MECESSEVKRQWGYWEMDLPSDDCCVGKPLTARSEWANLYPPETPSAFVDPQATVEGIRDTAPGEEWNERKLWGTFSCGIIGQPRDLSIGVHLTCEDVDLCAVTYIVPGPSCQLSASYGFIACCRSDILYIETSPELAGALIGVILEGVDGCGNILSTYSVHGQEGVVKGDPIQINVGHLKNIGFWTTELKVSVYADWNMDDSDNPNIGDTGDILAYFDSRAIASTNGAGFSTCQIITLGEHALANGASVTISGSTTTPSIDGTHTITVYDPYSFEITASVTVDGGGGTFTGGTGAYSPSIETLSVSPGTELNTDTFFGAVAPLGFPTTCVAQITIDAGKTWSMDTPVTCCTVPVDDRDELEIYFRDPTVRSKLTFLSQTFGGTATPLADDCGTPTTHIERLAYRRFPHAAGDATYNVRVRSALDDSLWNTSTTILVYADGGSGTAATSTLFVGNSVMDNSAAEFEYDTTATDDTCTTNLVATITYYADGTFTIA